MKILIVDDEINIADGLKAMIQRESSIPCKVRTCYAAREALKLNLSFHPDLVITDIVMPDMDGLFMIQELNATTPPPAIIILSGYEQFSFAQTALRYGVMDYLLKPVNNEQLMELIMRVYKQLPESYQQLQPLQLKQLPFFQQDLHDPAFPASLQRTIAYTEQNYMKDLTLQSIASEMLLSPNYLSTLINTHLKHSFNYLLDYVRLQKAMALIALEPGILISEVSYLVGYANERRLYHAFQHRLGFTPGYFREMYQKGNWPVLVDESMAKQSTPHNGTK